MRLKPFAMFAALATLLFAAQTAWGQYAPQYYPGGYAPAPAGYPQMQMQPMMVPYPAMMPPVVPASAVAELGGCDSCDGGGCDTCDGGCDLGCDGGCDGGCGSVSCCGTGWTHRMAFFGEFLYLRARDGEVPYAVEANGPIAPLPAVPIQVSRIALVDQDYEPAFRGGFGIALNCDSEIRLTYSTFDTSRTDQIVRRDINNIIRPMALHMGGFAANGDVVQAQARHDIEFDMIDVDYRGLFSSGCDHRLAYVIGVRYGMLEQAFAANYQDNGFQRVVTDVDFDGTGLRLGFDAEKYLGSGQVKVYAKGTANILAGEVAATFAQSSNTDPSIINTSWSGNRIVSIWDLEVGAGWRSKCDTWHATVGYTFSVWDNLVKTDEFIQAVQSNNFIGLGDSMTFDGLVGRIEARF